MVLAVVLAAAVAQPAAEAQAPPDYGPDVLVISSPVLAALEKGLRTEIALRAAFRKELAALKTKAQYEQCYREAMTSPESAKISEFLLSMPDDITPGEMRRRSERFGKQVEAFLLRKCGANPNTFDDTWRAARWRRSSARQQQRPVPYLPRDSRRACCGGRTTDCPPGARGRVLPRRSGQAF